MEIGADTGGTTDTILPVLKSIYSERMYFSYTYTDISPGFFITAKERFKDYPAMEYTVLDISKDPIAQGVTAESYDLIIACDVLHATPSINDTLRNVRKLDTLDIVPVVFHEFQARMYGLESNPTLEWAYANGSVLISRYHFVSVSEQIKHIKDRTAAKKLEMHQPGLASMYWMQTEVGPSKGARGRDRG